LVYYSSRRDGVRAHALAWPAAGRMRMFGGVSMKRLMTLIALAALAGSAQADFDKGLEAWNKGDYQAALAEFRPAAEQGDARAQYYLGEAFNKGRGEVQDFAEAANWYRKAAAQNNADAQENLCTMYFFGQAGITQDYSEAIKYCSPAGKQGRAYPAYLGAYM
jgi:TPR repeat protein